MCKHIHSTHHAGMLIGGHKREFPNEAQHAAIHAAGYDNTILGDLNNATASNAIWDALPDFPGFGGGSGGGITEAECVDAVKQAFKEGSG